MWLDDSPWETQNENNITLQLKVNQMVIHALFLEGGARCEGVHVVPSNAMSNK